MKRSVTISGAGLVGSLLAVLLRQRGHEVDVYERRPDMRKEAIGAGRSINMAISTRGWRGLEIAGLREKIEEIAIPMYGRYLHQADGSTAFQQYGKNKEAIYSISRGELNKQLMTAAEAQGATIHFNHRCNKVDVAANRLHLQDESGNEFTVEADLLFGADGAFSALRNSYVHMDRVNAKQFYIGHGYKELRIPPAPNGGWLIEKNALHIWPRRNFMLIALPNTDGSFTCTLFFPFEGDPSFESLNSEEKVAAFFKEHFPDAYQLMPTLTEDFFNNPTSSLITTHIEPWYFQDKSALIGDAAHAIVPFYGQGMNAGFEDCTVLSGLIDKNGEDWGTIFKEYNQKRKANGDAVAELALLNFIEMRDKVADPQFLSRKKIEQELGRRYPEKFTSIYEMVSFSHTPYSTAIRSIRAQDELLEKIMAAGDFFDLINNQKFQLELDNWVSNYHQFVRELDQGDLS